MNQTQIYAAMNAAIQRGRLCSRCGAQMLWTHQGYTTIRWECVTGDFAEAEKVAELPRRKGKS